MTLFDMRQGSRGAGPHVFRLIACSENQNHELTMSLSMGP